MNSLLLVFSLSVVVGAEPASPPATHTVPLANHTFTLPEGFEVELVAGPQLIERPIHADFDDRGRLYVCESSGTNDKVDKQLAERPHWILRLEDTDGDGRFDRSTKFADKMMFPEGMLWRDGSIYVGAPPSIWKLTDTDDDGVADHREEWFKGKTLTGCANDLHGPYAGLDGWIYWCKGAFAEQTYERLGKSPFKTRAAHIFRCRPDGSGIEPVMTGGMDNPVEVVFTPGGERIFTTTFFQHPGGGRRDGLIHAIYGGVYGKVHDVIDGHPRTGELMPVLTHFGAAAPSGLARYESRSFGPGYQDNLFAALFNLHKVTRHVLTPHGATFESHDEDFLVSNNLDFHPTDVLEDADGSLLVINTGGWYKLCCPTSQLWKPEILGGIYRVRRSGAKVVADPRGLKIDWSKQSPDKLALLLADERPAVRKRTMHELSRRQMQSLSVLKSTLQTASSAVARCRAVWTLSRIEGPQARAAIRGALGDSDETVRQAAIHSISVARDHEAVAELIELMRNGTAQNRRAAAEALGRLGSSDAVSVLLSVAGEDLDRTLEHSVTFALIEIADPAATAIGLTSANARTRRAALLAMDQMDGGGLEPEAVVALLNSGEPQIKETAIWILGQHSKWGAALAPSFERLLAAGGLAGENSGPLMELLARFAHDPQIQALLASRLQNDEAALAERRCILQSMSRSGLKTLPDNWLAPLAAVVRTDDDLAPLAVALVRVIPMKPDSGADLGAALLAAAANERLPVGVRLEALGAVPGGLGEVRPLVFDFVRENLSTDAQVSVRVAAADVLSKARLDDAQLLQLATAVRSAGPLEIERLVTPFSKSTSNEVGNAIIGALVECTALTNLRPEMLTDVFKDYAPDVREQSQTLFKLLEASAEQRKAKIEQLLTLAPRGDIHRGQLVFNNQKAACATCHAIGYLGGTVGPDLTRVGATRSERDLLEAIVFPSASFVRSYEPMSVTTTSGQVYSGIVRKDSPDEVVLVLNAKDTVRIARDEIEAMVPGAVSIMPAGLDQQLSAEDLVDLITFLKASK